MVKHCQKLSVNQIPNEVLEMEPLCEKADERVAVKCQGKYFGKKWNSAGHTFDIIHFMKYEKNSNIDI